MSNVRYPDPDLTLSKQQARRYLLAHHLLWPPHKIKGKPGIIDYLSRVHCIQYDPVNVVGRSPDLTLQSRIKNYKPDYLDELLYSDRRLLDGYDKVQSIFLTSDWPYFTRFRAYARRKYGAPENPPMQIAAQVLEAIRKRGPLSSLDLKSDDTVDWWWGVPTRLPRAALEVLYFMGEVGIHHRVNTRRVFDLIERLLPQDLLEAPDPNPDFEDYLGWHILRRVSGLGIANPSGTDHWLGILQLKSNRRRMIINHLVNKGELVSIKIEDLEQRIFYMRRQELNSLEQFQSKRAPKSKAAFIAPLDNLMWDRDMLRWLFNFDYTWEIYKPAARRQYGYYVLPVLYGERFIARFDPAFDKKKHALTINDWWWEPKVKPDGKIERALLDAFSAFKVYLNAEQILLSNRLSGDKDFGWLAEIVDALT